MCLHINYPGLYRLSDITYRPPRGLLGLWSLVLKDQNSLWLYVTGTYREVLRIQCKQTIIYLWRYAMYSWHSLMQEYHLSSQAADLFVPWTLICWYCKGAQCYQHMLRYVISQGHVLVKPYHRSEVSGDNYLFMEPSIGCQTHFVQRSATKGQTSTFHHN